MSEDYAQAQNMCPILNYDKSEDIRRKTSRIRMIIIIIIIIIIMDSVYLS